VYWIIYRNMKRYSDLQVTDLVLSIEIETIGNPDYLLTVNGQHYIDNMHLPLLDPINIDIEFKNKVYTTEYETAIIVDISIDNINIIPTYNHLVQYVNDHNQVVTSNYIGFNGKWTLTIDRPFYQWLHQVQNQGWLLD